MDIAQGTDNAGKVLGINASGNVEPTTVSGGEVWEEVDLSNFPRDWVNGDRIRVVFKISGGGGASDWNTKPSTPTFNAYGYSPLFDIIIGSSEINSWAPVSIIGVTSYKIDVTYLSSIYGYNNFNTPQYVNFAITCVSFNGGGNSNAIININNNNASTYIHKMWRLKK